MARNPNYSPKVYEHLDRTTGGPYAFRRVFQIASSIILQDRPIRSKTCELAMLRTVVAPLKRIQRLEREHNIQACRQECTFLFTSVPELKTLISKGILRVKLAARIESRRVEMLEREHAECASKKKQRDYRDLARQSLAAVHRPKK